MMENHTYDALSRYVFSDILLSFKSHKFTGKERDSESGLDNFGARYDSSQYSRFMTPDEFPGGIVDPFTGQQVEQPGPLPYADITDPQTLNKYGYVRNNPLRYIDPDGHDIYFLDNSSEEQFDRISSESPSFRQEIYQTNLDHNILVAVQQVGAVPLPDHAPGDAVAYRDANGVVHMTISVNPSSDPTTENEVGHENHARTKPDEFFKQAGQETNDRKNGNLKDHNSYPVEQTANKFRDKVEKERKQYRQEQKQLKREEKQRRKKRPDQD